MLQNKVEIFGSKHANGDIKWYWHVKAKNGKLTGNGQGYTTERGAIRGFRDHERIIKEDGYKFVRLGVINEDSGS